MGFRVKVSGDKRLVRQLNTMGDRVHRRVVRRAVDLATTPILQAARAEAPVDEGTLKRAMAKKVYTSRKHLTGGIVGADEDVVRLAETGKVGRLSKQTNANPEIAARPSKYDHLVEYGHVNADGTETPAHPFLRPAWDGSVGQARATYERELGTGIEREAAKNG